MKKLSCFRRSGVKTYFSSLLSYGQDVSKVGCINTISNFLYVTFPLRQEQTVSFINENIDRKSIYIVCEPKHQLRIGGTKALEGCKAYISSLCYEMPFRFIASSFFSSFGRRRYSALPSLRLHNLH